MKNIGKKYKKVDLVDNGKDYSCYDLSELWNLSDRQIKRRIKFLNISGVIINKKRIYKGSEINGALSKCHSY